MAKAPAFQFYPGDWLRDTALRACSLPARGLWIDMLCIMHQGEPYGHLTLKGNPIDTEKLARMVGGTTRDVTGRLTELEDAGVFSRTDTGTIYSRRMVEDERIRKARAAGGYKGGNPALKVNGKVREKVNLPTNLEITPSSSTSTSSSSSTSYDDDDDGARCLSLEEESSVRVRANRLAAIVDCTRPDNRQLVAKVALLWHWGTLSEDDVEQVIESFDRTDQRIRKKAGWLYRCLDNRCKEAGLNFEQMLKTTAVPPSLLMPPRPAALERET